MDDFIKIFVHLSLACTALEAVAHIFIYDAQYWYLGGFYFLISYVLCLCTELLGLKDTAMVKSPLFRNLMSCCHGLDGLGALILGLGLYYKSSFVLIVGLLILTKVFLLHIMNRMILANKKSDTVWESMLFTTKSFLHHVASFLFLSQYDEILLTTCWRTLSMTGHALLVLRGRLSEQTLQLLSLLVSYVRILFLAGLLALLLPSFCSSLLPILSLPLTLSQPLPLPSLHLALAKSAAGHVSYLVIRFGPVFRTGGAYLTGLEKEKYVGLSDAQRLEVLLSGSCPALSLELLLMALLTGMLGIMRLQTIGGQINMLMGMQ